jgi:hypothetical protein
MQLSCTVVEQIKNDLTKALARLTQLNIFAVVCIGLRSEGIWLLIPASRTALHYSKCTLDGAFLTTFLSSAAEEANSPKFAGIIG